MSHHVAVQLPDGMVVHADYRLPIVAIMRRITKNRDQLAADLQRVKGWAEQHPEEVCTVDEIKGGCHE